MEFLIVLVVNIIRVYKFMILARVLLSWFPVDPHNPLIRMLYQLTEPLLALFRSLLPRLGMIDLAPLVAFLLLDFMQVGVFNFLTGLLK